MLLVLALCELTAQPAKPAMAAHAWHGKALPLMHAT
jgi:hypothetical protein